MTFKQLKVDQRFRFTFNESNGPWIKQTERTYRRYDQDALQFHTVSNVNDKVKEVMC